MKQILSSKTRRQLELVELLFENDWITFVKASELLAIPTKTLKTDLNEVELLIDHITIETSKKYGIRLNVDPVLSIANIYQIFLRNSVEFQIIETIFSNHFNSMVELAEELFISISTLKRIVSRVNKTLQLEGFNINLKKMALSGDPLSICNFMQRYYKEKYALAENLLSTSQLAVLDNVLLCTLREHFSDTVSFTNFSFFNKLRICTYTVILFLKNNAVDFLNNTSGDSFIVLTDTNICNEFYRQFALQLTPFTLKNMLYQFFDPQYIRTMDCLFSEAKKHPHIQRTYKKISLLIQDLEKKMNCPCTKFNDILLHLYNLDNQLHGRTYIFHDTNKEFYLSLVHNYGHFVSEMIQSLHAVFYRTVHKEFIVFEAFFILFTEWPDFLESLERSVPSLKAGLLFDADKDFVEILARKTDYYLNNRFICTPLQISSLAELEKVSQSFDCIITNLPEISLSKIPVIVTPIVFDVKSFDKLMLFYENYFNI